MTVGAIPCAPWARPMIGATGVEPPGTCYTAFAGSAHASILENSKDLEPPAGIEPANLRFTRPLLYQLSYGGSNQQGMALRKTCKKSEGLPPRDSSRLKQKGQIPRRSQEKGVAAFLAAGVIGHRRLDHSQKYPENSPARNREYRGDNADIRDGLIQRPAARFRRTAPAQCARVRHASNLPCP